MIGKLICIQYVFLFIGLEDEGFETLEQLAYLYLANNKVSHTPDFQMFVLNADLKSAYKMQWHIYLFSFHLTIIYTISYSILIH